VTGLLTGHNSLRRHLHVMGLVDDPTCTYCGMGEESSIHVLCYCDAFASLRHSKLGSDKLDPKDIRSCDPRALVCFIGSMGIGK